MIVVAIFGIVACIGVPAIYHAMHPESLHTAVEGVVNACRDARKRAIWNSAPVDVIWNPLKGEYHVMNAPRDVAPVDPGAAPAPGAVPETTVQPTVGAETKPADGTSGQLSDRVALDMLEINFRPCKDDDFARVRFYPNGTCDECTIILRSLETGESKKITLELVTGLTDVAEFP